MQGWCLAAGLIGLLQVACSPGSPEDLLRALARELTDAVEAGQPGRILEHVAFDFRGSEELDYRTVQSIVDSLTLRPGPLGARLEHVEVTELVHGESYRMRARVSFSSNRPLAAGEVEGPLPAGATSWEFDLIFESRGDRWQAVGGRAWRD